MKKYTLAFICNASLEKVLLIHKLRPDWQVGKLNGIGGKIEKGEDSLACIMREVQEEACLSTIKKDWLYIGSFGRRAWSVDVYGYVYQGKLSDAKSGRDEQIQWLKVTALPKNTIENLLWLIPLTLDKIKHNEFERFFVTYHT